MRVHFEQLRGRLDLRRVLLDDGWKLDRGSPITVVAEHPEAPDEPSTRKRLYNLGLLTSKSIRIEFLPVKRSRGNSIVAGS